MTDDSIRTSRSWRAGCPALLGNDPKLAQDKASEPDHQLAFRQAANHGTLDDSSINWPQNRWILIYKNIQLHKFFISKS